MPAAELPIYLDYNATTPVHPQVAEAMCNCLDTCFGNPSSSHRYGIAAREAVETARKQIAQLLGCSPAEIVFTSGGTESDNYALKGHAAAHAGRGRHIITSQIEHPAVLNVCRYLESTGCAVTYVPVDDTGMVRPGDIERAIRNDTILISVMHANNEIGTIQPIREISRIARSRGIAIHTDAAQSIGKIPCNAGELGVDLLTIAGHKLYAPKGVGALYIRQGITLEPLLHGAAHEHGRRAGTENVPGIVALGKACDLIATRGAEDHDHLAHHRDRLQELLQDQIPEARVNGHPTQRLPNTLSVSFAGVNAGDLLTELRDKVAVSGGAACHDNVVEISHVLKAMGVTRDWAVGTIRCSLGIYTKEAEIDQAAEWIATAVKKLRRRR
jgi:cysteine desulfurase